MKKHYKLIIFVLIFFLSIGFSILTANLDITGSITFRDNVWDVHLENIEVESNSVDADKPVITDGNKIDFNITLTRPGDYYEFYVDVVNAGTMDATLDTITKTKLTGDYATYLNYSTTYYSDRAITKGDLLRSGFKEKIKIRVEYKYDVVDYKKLENIKLSLSLQYIKTDIQDSNYNELVWNFDSKAEEDVFTVPKTGTYKLEVWGAQGGNTSMVSGGQKYSAAGGYGGYSSGIMNINKNQVLYINAGGQGQSDYEFSGKRLYGGYNGGGAGHSGNSDVSSGGGGATHIAFKSGELKNLLDSKNDIVIVAGGGGGSGVHVNRHENNGGSGGGHIGQNGFSAVLSFLDYLDPADHFGTGGTQINGGTNNYDSDFISASFGFGCSSHTIRRAVGGGGGYYGGGCGYSNSASGGGGSGYIGNASLTNKVMYCYNCQESTEEATKTISTTNVSETPTSNYAKIGHGYARITFVE